MKRVVKNRLKGTFRLLFERGQRLGVSILPHHFYSQIPDIAELKRDPHWRAPSSMFGVSGCELSAQLPWLKSCFTPEMTEALPGKQVHMTAIEENGEDGGYGPVEAEVLYAFIVAKQPPKIIQVGCGVSTAIILRAAKEAGYKPEVVCVEPYPMPYLQQCHADGRIRLVREKAQKVQLDELTNLGEGDLFFVDSTHTVKPGSEVNRIILEILPRLKKGVYVHFHDIYFPYDYKRDVLGGDLFFWAESTLLHAFLIHNRRYTIRASLSMLHYSAPDELKKLILNYNPQSNMEGLRGGEGEHFPSSIFLQLI